MDIRYAILGLLSWQPLSGYDLKKVIAESDLFYWSGNNNQIYNSLVELHKNGFVSQEVELQESLPARKIYSITPNGQAELARWAASDPELPEMHHNFLIQLAWADVLSAFQLDGLLARYEEEIAIQLRMRLAQRERGLAQPARTPRERYLWCQINAHLDGEYQRELEWVREVRAGLQTEVYQQDRKEETQ